MKPAPSLLLVCMVLFATQLHAQICDPALPRSTPDNRFEIRRPGTITDKLTGLTWARCTLGQTWTGESCLEGKQWGTWFSWSEAGSALEQLNYAEYDDWRLPSREELATIIETACVEPSINLHAFPGAVSSYFWSASSDENDAYAWRLDFKRGEQNSDLKSSVSYRVRAVRGNFINSEVIAAQDAARAAAANTIPDEAERRRRIELMDDGIHDVENDQLAMLQSPSEAFASLPKTEHDTVNWVKALETELINPRADRFGETEMSVFDFNVVMAETREMPWVLFPHKAHTEWLTCSNCHPAIFTPKVGANPITMDKVLLGEYCGRCHGRVAFSVFECERCHQVLHQEVPEAWIRRSSRVGGVQ